MTDLVTIADADIRQSAPDYALGNRTEHTVSHPWNDNAAKLYLKFQLPRDFGTATHAALKITSANVYNPLWFFSYYVYGLEDDGGAGQEEWQERIGGAGPPHYWPLLTWNSAPANDVNSHNGFLPNARLLGTFTETDDLVENVFASQALADFLNDDSDGFVTLMISKVTQTSNNSTFVSREGAGGTYPTANPPTLSVAYEPTCVKLGSDLNGDCYVNWGDFSVFAGQWLATGCDQAPFCQGADLDKDGSVNWSDFGIFAASWLACSDPNDPGCDEYWKPEELARKKWTAWRRSWTSFPIGAWSYFSRYDGTVAEYQVYEQANLTMVQTPLDQYANAVAAGLKPIIGTWDALYADPFKLRDFMETPSATDSALAAYHFKDDMRQPDIKLMVDPTYTVYLEDLRGAIPMTNVLPSYGSIDSEDPNVVTYEQYLDQYIQEVSPAVLCYAFYGLMSDGTDRAGFYDNMELIRSKAQAAGIGWMGFALANGHINYREPSESDLNWQAWSLVTYGAKGLWYYNYRIEPTGGFGEGLVTHADGTPRVTYYMAQAINADLKAMGPTLLKLRSTGVYHADSADPNNPTITLYANGVIPVLSDFASSRFLLGQFENMDDPGDQDTYLMVMNKRHSATTTSAQEAADAIFTANPTSLKVYRFNTTTQQWDLLSGSGGTYTINVGGGQAVLLRFSVN